MRSKFAMLPRCNRFTGRGDGSWNGVGGILTSMTDATTSVLTTVAIAGVAIAD